MTGSYDVVDPRRVDFEYFAIEKKDGAQRLSLSGGGNVVVDGEVGEKSVEVLGIEFFRMPPVELEEPVRPAEIGLFGSDGVVADTDRVSHSLEEPG